jgi:hypothetical protein
VAPGFNWPELGPPAGEYIPMKLVDILLLLFKHRSPTDWMRVNNESGDGGFMLFSVHDVQLGVSVNLISKGGKPATRFELVYNSTILAWADQPYMYSDELKDNARILSAVQKHFKGLGKHR